MKSGTNMKKTVWSLSIHLLAMAAARWVFPEPLGPVKTSQPRAFSAKSFAAWSAVPKSLRLSGSASCPSVLVPAKLTRPSGPRLL
jgi:hypothetical protein